jgi:hypothetical protein
MGLRDELTKLDKEISESDTELRELDQKKTLLQARLAGLREQRRMLDAAVAADESDGVRAQPSLAVDVTKLTLADAIEALVRAAAAPLSIADVRERLTEHGRTDDPNSVSVTLAYLATGNKVKRIARGVYGRPPSADDN